jgi:hypothetical protein
MELKREGGRSRPLQRHLLDRHDKAGGFSFLLSPKNKKEVYNWVKALAETGTPNYPEYERLDNGLSRINRST